MKRRFSDHGDVLLNTIVATIITLLVAVAGGMYWNNAFTGNNNWQSDAFTHVQQYMTDGRNYASSQQFAVLQSTPDTDGVSTDIALYIPQGSGTSVVDPISNKTLLQYETYKLPGVWSLTTDASGTPVTLQSKSTTVTISFQQNGQIYTQGTNRCTGPLTFSFSRTFNGSTVAASRQLTVPCQ